MAARRPHVQHCIPREGDMPAPAAAAAAAMATVHAACRIRICRRAALPACAGHRLQAHLRCRAFALLPAPNTLGLQACSTCTYACTLRCSARSCWPSPAAAPSPAKRLPCCQHLSLHERRPARPGHKCCASACGLCCSAAERVLSCQHGAVCKHARASITTHELLVCMRHIAD